MTIRTPAACYSEGFNAFLRYGDLAVCPYGLNTPQRSAWYNGFTRARVGPEAEILRYIPGPY